MDTIPESDYQWFWEALASQFDGDVARGFSEAKSMIRGTVIKRYPTCYFDFDEVIYRAIPLAAKSYNPFEGVLATTYLCHKALGVAADLIRTKSHPSKWEMQFSDIDTEEKPGIEERTATEDNPNESVVEFSWLKERLQSQRYSCGKTFWDLAKLLRDDLGRGKIAKAMGVSAPTLRKMIGALQDYTLKIAPELVLEYIAD